MKFPPRPTAALLEHQPFLKGVPWRQLERLAELAAYATFPEQAVIFEEGAEAASFQLLLAGRVALRANSARTEPTLLQVLDPGDALGWSWAFPPNHWTLTAVALEPVTTLVFPARPLRNLCDEDPVLGCVVFRRISRVLLDRLTASRRRLAVAEHAAAGVPLRITVAPAASGPPPG